MIRDAGIQVAPGLVVGLSECGLGGRLEGVGGTTGGWGSCSGVRGGGECPVGGKLWGTHHEGWGASVGVVGGDGGAECGPGATHYGGLARERCAGGGGRGGCGRTPEGGPVARMGV